MIDIQRIDHIALTVHSVAASTLFYQRNGFTVVLAIPRATFLRSGDANLALFPCDDGAGGAKARGSMDRSVIAIQHVAFRVAEGSLERWQAALTEAGSPTRGPIDHELNRSLYLEDPDGHQLEFTHPL